jgi:Zn-dependent alcohol dehydrogenase
MAAQKRILGLYANGKLDLVALIGKTIPLQGINHAFRELEAGIDTRTVITFS